MDVYDRCTNLGEKILLIVLPSMVEAETFQTTHGLCDTSSITSGTV